MSQLDEKDMELLSAYIDDELEDAKKERVTSFLATSPEARRALEELRNTKSLFSATPPVHAPADLLDFLENKAEKLMEQEEKKSFWNWSNPWAWTSMTATASAAALALMVGLHSPRQIPYEALMAAHANAQSVGGVHQSVMSAAHSSSLYNADSNAKA